MSKLVKILIVIIAFITTCRITYAYSIDNAISDSGVNRGAIAISVKNADTGKTLYELHQKRPMIPASTLKLVTYTAAVDTLGQDFKFKTELYKNTNNEVYLKLGADPFLTTNDLEKLIGNAVSKKIVEPKKFYIDDFVIDSVEWGEGWQWDDEMNPIMPKVS